MGNDNEREYRTQQKNIKMRRELRKRSLWM